MQVRGYLILPPIRQVGVQHHDSVASGLWALYVSAGYRSNRVMLAKRAQGGQGHDTRILLLGTRACLSVRRSLVLRQ